MDPHRKNSDLARTQKKICYQTMAAALVVAVFSLIIGQKTVAKGFVLGTCFSMVNFLLLGVSVHQTIGRSRFKAGMIGLFSILSRYAIIAIPLIVAIKSASFNFIAVAVGIFAVQLVILIGCLVMSVTSGEGSYL